MTKTVDETTAETGAEATEEERAAEQTTDVTETGSVSDTESAAESAAESSSDADADADADADPADDGSEAEELPAAAEGPTGVGQGAASVVSAALGLVSLTGGWIGTVAAARETLVGQLHTSSSASVAKQVKEIYGDAWQTTALWAGLFALAALATGVVVLARPAFGTPRRPQVAWIRSVAWAGVVLGVVGLLLAVLKYSGALLALPSTS